MPKKGEKIRGRTPEEQALYDAVIGRLMSGESARAIADEFGVNVQKLWDWKSVEKKRLAKRAARSGFDVVVNVANMPASPELADDLLHPETPALEVVSASPADSQQLTRENTMKGEGVKGSLIEQASIGADSLIPLRGNVREGLEDLDKAIRKNIFIITRDLERGKTTLSGQTGGEIITEEIDIGLRETAQAASALKMLSQEFADLHCLPHGSLKIRGVDFSPSTPSQHLHLHSSGGATAGPLKAIKNYSSGLPSPQSTPHASEDNEEDEQSSLLNNI